MLITGGMHLSRCQYIVKRIKSTDAASEQCLCLVQRSSSNKVDCKDGVVNLCVANILSVEILVVCTIMYRRVVLIFCYRLVQ